MKFIPITENVCPHLSVVDYKLQKIKRLETHSYATQILTVAEIVLHRYSLHPITYLNRYSLFKVANSRCVHFLESVLHFRTK